MNIFQKAELAKAHFHKTLRRGATMGQKWITVSKTGACLEVSDPEQARGFDVFEVRVNGDKSISVKMIQ